MDRKPAGNPLLYEKGMLMAFNPLEGPVTRTLRFLLNHTGYMDQAHVNIANGRFRTCRAGLIPPR